jgi:uncharacterized membrane protein
MQETSEATAGTPRGNDAPKPAPSRRSARIDVVDWLRGVAVVLMIMAHGMDAWLLPAAKSGPIYAVIRVGSGIPARLFLLLVGVSAAIQFEAGIAKGLSTTVMRARLIKRGAQILVLAYLFRLQEWLLSHFYGGWETLLKVDILNAIGASMLVLALVATPRNGRRQIVPALLLAGIFLGFGATVGPAQFPTWLPTALTSYVGGQRPMAWFSLFPWGDWSLVGVVIGHAWVALYRRDSLRAKGFALTFLVGAMCTGMVHVVRAIDPTIIRYPSDVIMQMGPGIFFHRLGLIFMLAGVGYFWCRWLGPRFSIFRQLGRTSLLVYWIHIEFCYGSFVYELRNRFHVLGATLLVLTLTSLMLIVSLAKTRFAGPATEWLRARFRGTRLA